MRRIVASLWLALLCSHGAEPGKLTPGGVWAPHDLKRPRPPVVTPAPVDRPAPAPPEALVLFDGRDLRHWTAKLTRGPEKGKTIPPQWKIEQGHMEAVPNGGTLICTERFGDCHLHLEWAAPAKVEGMGQGRGNSGVLIQGLCEVQVLDSYQNDTYPDGQAGAVYSQYPPLVNACRPPGEWQSFDITLQVARLDGKKKVVEPARITVVHNGILIQDAVALADKPGQSFTLALQDHLNPVRFRNVWMRKYSDPKASPAKEAAARFAKPAPKDEARVGTSHPFVTAAVGFDQGEHLLATLNCSSCHAPAGLATERFPVRKAPHMGEVGLRLAPGFIRDFLSNPQREKPGTTMPDLLHGLSPAARGEAVEALTHFLVSVSPKDDTATAGDESVIARGRALYHEVGCVACHAPQSPPPGKKADPVALRTLAASSVPFANLAKKYTVSQLTELLLAPGKYRPERRMPSSKLSRAEAVAISMYLVREQAVEAARRTTPAEGQRTSGLRYELFDGVFPNCGPALEMATPIASGSIGRLEISQWAQERQPFAVRFTGQMELPASGSYTFSTRSTDGSRLWVDGVEVVDNDGRHGNKEARSVVELAQGTHQLTVTYFQGPKTKASLEVFFEGPGSRKLPIYRARLSHLAPAMRPLGEMDFLVDAAKAQAGKKLYGQLGCALCHPTSGVKGVPAAGFAAEPLLQLGTNATGGCLAETPSVRAPDYGFSAEQRAALRKTVAAPEELRRPTIPQREVARVMNLLNCYACHARDGIGGPPSPRAEYFQGHGATDLGDEGRIPPHLTKVGAKLQPSWMKEVLLHRGEVRPYMATRMPLFGAPVERLAASFVLADAGSTAPGAKVPTADFVKAGQQLVGVGGYSCIVCHSFGKHPSLGVPAVDLASMTKRLQPDWFARYVVDPQALRPGTRMPSFWPHGAAANREILSGNTQQQIGAIWAYLSGGPQADPPPGLIQAKMELVAEREPILQRGFLEQAGPRGIAVGYPEKVNLAFDADESRLALLWQGPFIDASKHRTGRGGGLVGAMGSGVVKLPSGPALAALADADTPWPGKAEVGFHGYAYDAQRRPTFRYTWRGVAVEDLFVPMPGQAGFHRTLTLRSTNAPEHAYFRAATGRIEAKEGGQFLIEGKLRITFQGAQGVVRGTGEKAELLVPITFQNGAAKLVEVFTW